MNEFIGRQIDFGLAVEGTRGTAASTATRALRKVTCNVIPRAERVIDDTTNGRLEDSENVRTVRRWSEGDVEGILHADVLGYFLLNIYGEVNSQVVAGSVYDHTFVMEQSITHPTMSLFVKDADVRQEVIAGAVLSTFEINVETDNYIRFSANFLGLEGEDDSSEMPELDTEYDFVSRDVTVKIAETESGLTAVPALKLKSQTITWNTNAEADWVFGSYSPDNIYNKQMSIEGSFTRNFTDETFKDLYEGSGFVYMKISIEGEADLGAGNKPTVTILLNKVQVTDWNRTSAGDDLVTEEVSFKAFYNAEDEAQSSVVIRNLTSAYAVGS